jgi:hypothetical protein
VRDATLAADPDAATWYGFIQILTNVRYVDGEIEPVRTTALQDVFMHLCDCRDARGSLLEPRSQRRIIYFPCLKLEHTCHNGQTVLDPVCDLPEQHLLALKRGLEVGFIALTLNGHSQDVGGTLEEGNVVFAEILLGPAVDLQNAEWPTLSLQDDIHGAANAMLHQELGGSKSPLVFKVIGDDRPTRTQREAGGRCKVITDGRSVNDACAPAHTGTDQETPLVRNVFHNLAKLGLHALGCQAYCIVQQLVEARSLKRGHTKFRKHLLLPDASFEGRRQKRVEGCSCMCQKGAEERRKASP